MNRSNRARAAAAIAGAFAFLAGAATFVRRRRFRRGGSMQDTKEIARRVLEGPWQGKLDAVIELVGDDYVGHVPGVPQPIRGKDGFQEFASSYLAAFPDGTITVDHQIAEGDFVATRWTGRGTNTGELMGMPPTGRQVTIEGITYSRVADGKAHEAWLIWDTLSMMQQLGAVPESAPARTT
jgi:steroid delta-isomerase-like uncharacterized protein